MIITVWILMHTVYAILITPETAVTIGRTKIVEDFKAIILYIIMCVALFCYDTPLHIALVMSCVIGCFYVFCGLVHGIAMIYAPKRLHWAFLIGINNLFVAATVYFLLYTYYG
jgi:hypothetical protein